MIDSVKIRRQCSLDFYSHYEHLCGLHGCLPLSAVRARKLHGVLDINADRIKAPDWAPLLNAVRHNKTLTSIAIRSLHHQGHGDSGAERQGTYFKRKIPAIRSKDLSGQLCKAIKGCLTISNALRNLELQGLLLREKDVILLGKGLVDTSSLESLSLAHSPIGDGGLEIICQSVKNSACIRSVDFTGCSLTWRGVEHIASVLKHQAIKRHSEAWAESLRYRRPDLDCMAGLRRITLNCNLLIGDRGAAVLAGYLAEDLWLKALDLQQCGISSDGAKLLLDAFKTNTTLVVLDIRKNPLVDHALIKTIIEKVLMNTNGANLEYKWLLSPSSKDVKNKPRKRTVVLGNGRKGKATIRIGFASKKSINPGKVSSCDKESYAPKPLPAGARGFLPWRTAARAKQHRASSVNNIHELPLQIQAGIPLKVTVESASTSEIDETDDAVDDICDTDATKSPEIINLKQHHQLQIDYEECQLRLKDERKARLTAEERVMELEVENARLRNLNSSLSEVLHAQSVASTILEDEDVLDSIENSFQKFHAFLDLLKDAGLGQLATMAGIDQSDFGLLQRPQMTSTLNKPAITQKENSFEEERQKHMQNVKNSGSVSFPGRPHFQTDLVPFQDANNFLLATGDLQQHQVASQSQQSVKQGMEENAPKNNQSASSEKSSKPMDLEERVSSMRQQVTDHHSVSDPSVNLYSGNSNKYSVAASGDSKKLSSKRLCHTTSFSARGDQSIHETDPSRNDTVGSDSEIQENIHSMGSV
ncbi:PREDICTED: centrosomal protein of 78 kDa [Gekko japonicus]|uniref:Centrosomal protein of 78 kDa n=1 Tax=Gekko japonicus TaxID=146911 RepID=A0ABM1KRI4_GEKJA|nr:PREDICTED: centrosomal protein of 78 kDa [Gekko japonicus]